MLLRLEEDAFVTVHVTGKAAIMFDNLGIPRDDYEPDLALLDRYQAFSAEIVRMSVLGIGVVGFLVQFLSNQLAKAPVGAMLLVGATLLLAGSCGAALGHKYFSVDGMFHHLRGFRKTAKRDECARMRAIQWDLSSRFLRGSVLLATAGSLALAAGFAVLLTSSAHS